MVRRGTAVNSRGSLGYGAGGLAFQKTIHSAPKTGLFSNVAIPVCDDRKAFRVVLRIKMHSCAPG